MIDHVAIIGAGFSGTLQAINLLRHEGPRATLIERADTPGLGLAYGAAQPEHLLNVRAGNMSALPDDPDHFVRWLRGEGIADPEQAFIPRRVFGRYLRAQLDAALAGSNGRLVVRRGSVVDARTDGGGARLTFSDGTTLNADAAVLAVGNLPPHDPPGLEDSAMPSDLYAGDPWAGDIAAGLTDDDTVLVIGTGLTMIDTALTLDSAGFRGTVVALSRRGLLPRRHAAMEAWRAIDERPRERPAALLHRVRERAEAIGWRAAVDELRPFTQAMWANATDMDRARFLRHLRPWWDVHRHRLAPQVAARIDGLVADGRLRIVAGRTLSFTGDGNAVVVAWQPRGDDVARTMRVRRVINCTGPLGDLSRTDDPLLRALAARGTIRADAARIGIDVDAAARTIAADGTPNDRLYALGPMTRGAFWEIVAVPDIRTQTWTLARRLSNAHWVGGEGL